MKKLKNYMLMLAIALFAAIVFYPAMTKASGGEWPMNDSSVELNLSQQGGGSSTGTYYYHNSHDCSGAVIATLSYATDQEAMEFFDAIGALSMEAPAFGMYICWPNTGFDDY